MSLLPVSNDYTDKDFASLRARLFALVQSVFPEWTDQNRADFGNILVELFAHVGDVLAKYQDNQARESRWATAQARRSLLALVKLVGYVPSTSVAATANITLALAAVAAADVTIPAGDYATTADITDPIRFQLLADAVIPAGSTSLSNVLVEHSENAQDAFTSTGLADQEFELSTTPYIEDSAIVAAANGAYVQRDSLLDSTSSDRHYTVTVDQNDRARVRFGNGTNGALPTGTITVAYKTGGGSDGNVTAGAIKRLENNYTDALGNAVQLTVTNPAAASGGADRETNAQIRVNAPAHVRARVNSITREDFEIHARLLAGVERALMLTSNEDVAVPENSGVLYVVPTGGGAPTSLLKAAVLTQVTVTYPCTLTFVVNVQDPVYKTINISVTAFRQKGISAATMKANIVAAFVAFFAITNSDGTPNESIDFGANLIDENGASEAILAWSDLFNVARDASGVRRVDSGANGFLLNTVRGDVTLAKQEFPVLGTVEVIDGDTSTVIP